MSRLKYLITACVLALTVGTANAATFVVTGVTGDPQIGEILEGTVDVTNLAARAQLDRALPSEADRKLGRRFKKSL